MIDYHYPEGIEESIKMFEEKGYTISKYSTYVKVIKPGLLITLYIDDDTRKKTTY